MAPQAAFAIPREVVSMATPDPGASPSHRTAMPRDDFARLERRWQKRPLFLRRRPRAPILPVVVSLLALAGVLVSTLIDPHRVEALIAGVTEALNADAHRSEAAAARTAGPAAAPTGSSAGR